MTSKNSLFFVEKSKLNLIINCVTKGIVGAIMLLCFIVIAFLAFHNYYRVEGPSMKPTFEDNQHGVFTRLDKNVEKGDIAIFYLNEKRLIKRVIATSGDKIAYYQDLQGEIKLLRINKGSNDIEVLTEDYVVNKDGYYNSMIAFYNHNCINKIFEVNKYNNVDVSFIVIPENFIFFMGDNRLESYDCSNFGAVSKQSLLGKVDLIVKNNGFYLDDILGYLFDFKEN